MSILLSLFGFGNTELTLISVFILFVCFVVWTIADVMRNQTLTDTVKLIWVAIILFFPFFGTLIYLFFGRSKEHLSKNN